MKMPKKHYLAAILAAKEQNIGAIRLQWRTFAADIMAVRLQKQSTQRCAPLSPSSFVTFSASIKDAK